MQPDPPTDADKARHKGRSRLERPQQILFLLLGCLMLVLAVIGALLPLMPTTIFLILAAWCFGRSSPRLESWMLNHRNFGPILRNWRASGAIPRKAKVMACGGMSIGYVVFIVSAQPQVWLAVMVAAALVATATWIVLRPET